VTLNRRIAALALVSLAAVGVGAQTPQPSPELPAGPGRETLTTRCVTCHQGDVIAQQRLTRAGWGREVDKMVRWGAVVDAGEREPLLDYLAAHFAPTPAAAHIVATASSESTYKRACFVCHEDDVIEAQRLSRDGWGREVDKMMRWGANVTAADRDALVDYLAARYPRR